MPLYFITGNKNKFAEVSRIIADIEQIEIDLPEIQHIDAREVISAKLKESCRHKQGEFIVEDTSLYIDGLKGLPGPLGKWFEKTVGYENVYKMAEYFGNTKAKAVSMVGYARNANELYFFEGVLTGTVVSPRGENGFGWDTIFVPNNFEKTFAEMSFEEKNSLSMRREAFEQLKEFLNSGVLTHIASEV